MRRKTNRRPIGLTGIIILIFIGILSTVQAQTPQLPLSDHAAASVITCGPGNDFYLAFGHSAIRISDTTRGIDYVYNYGTFDFDTPHFYWNFARGMLNYCLSRTTFDRFLATYDYERRAVWEQRLDLSTQELNNLFLALEWNYQPENRYYRYDFFRDNCATRVRDMVESACGKRKIESGELQSPMSYRNMVHRSTDGGCLQWWTLGVDLLLGLPADHRVDSREAMFHPIAMMQLYADASRNGHPLVSGTRQWLDDIRTPLRRSFPPLVLFALVLAAVALLTWKRRWPRWADRTLFILAGLVGLVLLFMWVGTDHWCTRWNMSILWASPLLLLIAIRLDRSPRWALWLQLACFVLAMVWVLWCGLSLSLVPVILTLTLRVACLIPRKPRPQQLPR